MITVRHLWWLSTVFMIGAFTGCAPDNGEREVHQTQEQGGKDTETGEGSEIQKEFSDLVSELEVITEMESGATTKTEPETELAADYYGSVKVSELDYDSFQSRMTDEEWEGFQQYFPVLRENAPFYYADGGDFTYLNIDGKPVGEGEYALYTRYASEEVIDFEHYIKDWGDFGECLIEEVRVFDLDGDGVQELILQSLPGPMFLILHRENEDFYGWQVVYRGFEALQTNGIYIGSGGAGANCWLCIRFDHEGWLEEILAEEDWGEYYLHGEAVDEDTFWKQVDEYWTENVTGYESKQFADGK
ncbi:MAG: hypothetical protein K2N44_04430 [Lachnospiraceae bacterium]|nr:hypothetical protein [Lachnospiraceae bacterium]